MRLVARQKQTPSDHRGTFPRRHKGTARQTKTIKLLIPARKNAGLFTVRRLGFCDQHRILFIQFIQRGFKAETDLAAALFDVDDLHRQGVAFLADVRDLLETSN